MLFLWLCVCVKDDEGKTGPFLDEIKKWFQQQKEQYIAEIKEQLGDTRWELLCYSVGRLVISPFNALVTSPLAVSVLAVH